MKKTIVKKPASEQDVIDALRAFAKEPGGGRVRLKNFLAQTKGIVSADIYRHFPSWNGAIAAAGFECGRQREHVETGELLKDWGTVTRKLKRPATYTAYDAQGKYSSSTIQSRFGGWINVRQAFRAFAEGRDEWADVLEFCPPAQRLPRIGGRGRSQMSRRMRRRHAPARPREGRPSFGEPVDNMPGLLNAPMNENGVILVFGMLAERLGFHIRAVRPTFPDCIAMRWVGGTTWQEQTIEFEYESKNFHSHRHPPDGCDVLVCWKHNWENCPANMEVIALSEELERLRDSPDFISPAGNPDGRSATIERHPAPRSF